MSLSRYLDSTGQPQFLSYDTKQQVGTCKTLNVTEILTSKNIDSLYIESVNISATSITPNTIFGSSVGSATFHFENSYFGTLLTDTGTVATSDANYKNAITDLDKEKHIDLVQNLRPVQYKLNSEGENAKWRYGFLAQEVEKTRENLEIEEDSVVVEKDDGKGGTRFYMSYTELIAPLVFYCQKLEERIAQLENNRS